MAIQNFGAQLKKIRRKRNLSFRHLLSVENLSLQDLTLLFECAQIFQKILASSAKKIDLLKGQSLINFVNENSTRTRPSFEMAGKHLGLDVVNVVGSASSLQKGETLNDTGRTLDALAANLIVIRDQHAGVPYQISQLVQAKIINGGDGWHEHPTQALLEAFTLWEKFQFRKLTYLFVGDALHSRVFGSQVRLYKKLGYTIRLVAPFTLVPKKVENFGVQVFPEFSTECLQGVDALHAIRLQTERAAGKFIATPREYSKNYCLNLARVGLAKKTAVILHAGPVIRDFDIRTEVLESPNCLVQKMVTNGLAVRMALLWLMAND